MNEDRRRAKRCDLLGGIQGSAGGSVYARTHRISWRQLLQECFGTARSVLPWSVVLALGGSFLSGVAYFLWYSRQPFRGDPSLLVTGIEVAGTLAMVAYLRALLLLLATDSAFRWLPLSAEGLRLTPRLMLIDLVYILGVTVGFIMVVIPGVILAIRWAFAIVLAVEMRAGVVGSFRCSWRLTRGSSVPILIVGVTFLSSGFLFGVLFFQTLAFAEKIAGLLMAPIWFSYVASWLEDGYRLWLAAIWPVLLLGLVREASKSDKMTLVKGHPDSRS